MTIFKKMCATVCAAVMILGNPVTAEVSSMRADASVAFATHTKSTKCKIKYVTGKVGKTSVKPIARTSNSIHIKWKKAKGATRYYVYRYSSVSKKWTRVANTKSLSFRDKKLTPSATYKYKVNPYKKENNTLYVNNVSKIYKTGTRPKSADIVKAYDVGDDVKICWCMAKCSKYKIMKYNVTTKKWSVVKVLNKNAFSTLIRNGAKSTCKFSVVPVNSVAKGKVYKSLNNIRICVNAKAESGKRVSIGHFHKYSEQGKSLYRPAYDETVCTKQASTETVKYYKCTCECTCGEKFTMVVDEATYKIYLAQDDPNYESDAHTYVSNEALISLGNHKDSENTKLMSDSFDHWYEVIKKFLVDHKYYTSSELNGKSYQELENIFYHELDAYDRWDINVESNKWDDENLSYHYYAKNGVKIDLGSVDPNLPVTAVVATWEPDKVETVYHPAEYKVVHHNPTYKIDSKCSVCGHHAVSYKEM